MELSPEQLAELIQSAVSKGVAEVLAAQPQVVNPTEEKGTPLEMASLEGLDPNSPQYKFLAMSQRYKPVIETQKSESQQQAIAQREQMNAMLAARKEADLRGKLPENYGGKKPQASGAHIVAAPKDFNEAMASTSTPVQLPPNSPEMNRYQAAMATKFNKGVKK